MSWAVQITNPDGDVVIAEYSISNTPEAAGLRFIAAIEDRAALVHPFAALELVRYDATTGNERQPSVQIADVCPTCGRRQNDSPNCSNAFHAAHPSGEDGKCS